MSCIIGISFALGGWVVSIRVQEASLPYKNRATKQFEQVQSEAGPNPLATVKCLKRESAAAKTVARQGIAAATTDEDVPVPSLAQIPNCPNAPYATGRK